MLEELRVTDSGVDSEQTSTATLTSSEIRADNTEREVVTSSDEEKYSHDSRDVIGRETVTRMRNIFEEKINKTKVENLVELKKPSSTPVSSQPRLKEEEDIRGQVSACDKDEVERLRSSSVSSASTIQSEAEQTKPGDFLVMKHVEMIQTRTRDSGSGSHLSERSVRDSVPKTEVLDVSVGKLRQNFEGSEINVINRTEAVRQSEVKEVSVGRLKNSFENILREKQQSERSFLRWKSSNLSLRPRPGTRPESMSSTSSISRDQDWEGEREYEESLSEESLNIQSEDEEMVQSGSGVVVEYSESEGTEEESITNKSDIKTGRVSVSELKNIFSGERVEVN